MFLTSDRQLIDKALSGSDRAWIKLVKRYQTEIYNHAFRMTANHSDAFDLMQDIFLAVFRNLPGFRGESKFRTWLYRIATNHGIDFLRKRKMNTTEINPDNHSDESRFDDHIEQWQQNRIISVLLNILSVEQRTVLELKFYQQFTFEEISCQMGISVNTAKTRFYSALEKLRKQAGEDNVQAACL